jgi:hypothetical protein
MIPVELRVEQQPQTLFQQAIAQGEQEHNEVLIKRFEHDENPYNNQDYHTLDHGNAVKRRTVLLLTRMHHVDPTFVTKRDIAIGGYIAKGHDRVQDWDPELVKVNDAWVVKRRRHLGDNERNTAKEMIEYMHGVNETYGTEIFTLEDMMTVIEAQNCTIPTFKPKLMTVVQEKLTPQTSPIARAVALADIGGAGMDPAWQFLKEGDNLFKEENLDIREALRRGYPLTKELKEYFSHRIIGWGNAQRKWIEGRQDRLEEELEGLSDDMKNAIRPLFCHFESNIIAAEEMVARRKHMPFRQLVIDMRYTA